LRGRECAAPVRILDQEQTRLRMKEDHILTDGFVNGEQV
jgi:hypothetical protein